MKFRIRGAIQYLRGYLKKPEFIRPEDRILSEEYALWAKENKGIGKKWRKMMIELMNGE